MSDNLLLEEYIPAQLEKANRQRALYDPYVETFDPLLITEERIKSAKSSELREWKPKFVSMINDLIKPFTYNVLPGSVAPELTRNKNTHAFSMDNFSNAFGQAFNSFLGAELFNPEATSLDYMFNGLTGNNETVTKIKRLGKKLVLINQRLDEADEEADVEHAKFLDMQRTGKLPYGVEHEYQLKEYNSNMGKYYFDMAFEIIYDRKRGLIEREPANERMTKLLGTPGAKGAMADFCAKEGWITQEEADYAKYIGAKK